MRFLCLTHLSHKGLLEIGEQLGLRGEDKLDVHAGEETQVGFGDHVFRVGGGHDQHVVLDVDRKDAILLERIQGEPADRVRLNIIVGELDVRQIVLLRKACVRAAISMGSPSTVPVP